MLKMFLVQLKAQLNAARKIVDNAITFLLGNRLDLPSDGYLQYDNGARVTQEDFVLEEP